MAKAAAAVPLAVYEILTQHVTIPALQMSIL
jgi:hypothetical protein